jgi:hypothetical protein
MRNTARFRLWSDLIREIAKDTASLLLNRYIFRQVQEVVRRNQDLHGTFNRWMQVNYMTAASSGIRRHLLPKRKDGDVSFVRLLDEMIQAPQTYSREDFLSYYRPRGWTEKADRWFDHFGGRGGDHLSKRILGADRKEFIQKGSRVQDFATARVAHLLFRQTPRATFDDLDDALDCLERLIEKYLLVFGNTGTLLQAELRKLDPNWSKVFLQPWATRHAYYFVFNVLRGKARAERIVAPRFAVSGRSEKA